MDLEREINRLKSEVEEVWTQGTIKTGDEEKDVEIEGFISDVYALLDDVLAEITAIQERGVTFG